MNAGALYISLLGEDGMEYIQWSVDRFMNNQGIDIEDFMREKQEGKEE